VCVPRRRAHNQQPGTFRRNVSSFAIDKIAFHTFVFGRARFLAISGRKTRHAFHAIALERLTRRRR